MGNAAMVCFHILFTVCSLNALAETDYALSVHRDAWLRHPVYGDPSFDAFVRLPCNPVITGQPPLEWPVNGFLFRDPPSGIWYLYAGNYSEGYAIGADKKMICTVHRSTDAGKYWEDLGPVFDESPFYFNGDNSPADFAPDVSVTYHEGRYHLVYDWVNNHASWAELVNPQNRENDSGVGYAWSDRPEGPFIRATTPVKRTSEQALLCGRYKRLYASTLIRREQDWLILTLTDSGPFFAWALLGMTAPAPEGPWSDLVPLLHVDQPTYLPPLLEYFPAFQHQGYIYAPATSVARNRNYQALFRVRVEEAMNPKAWENVAWGGLWHAEPNPEEFAGIWGQTFSGLVDESGCFTVLFPSRNADNRGTLNIAQRLWSLPFRERGFVISGHGGPSLGLLKNAYRDFTLQVRLSFSGAVAVLWHYAAPLGPNEPRSDAALHPLSLTRYQGIALDDRSWKIISVDESGQASVHANGSLEYREEHDLQIDRNEEGPIGIIINGEEWLPASLPGGAGAMGILVQPQSRASVSTFQVVGTPIPAPMDYLYTEALVGAGQSKEYWQWVEDSLFRYGKGAVSIAPNSNEATPPIAVKWNVECTAFKIWAPSGPDYGQADLYLNETLLATLDFSADAPETSRVRYASFPLPPGRYAIALHARSGRMPVDCLECVLPVHAAGNATESDENTRLLSIAFPRDGDIVNRNDGQERGTGLQIKVKGLAPENIPVLVNGCQAERFGNAFSCPVEVTGSPFSITAETATDRVESRVFYDKASRKRYRFSVDDNIQFLKDLGMEPGRYPSLFDHWYLAFWREMHERYGAKIHLNIYYQTDGFDLTQMPDQWKEEWGAHAAWLHLTFHALQDKPDRPYRNASYAQLAHDYDLVTGHIRRFAGDTVIGNTTTVHWAECPKPGVLALRDRGIKNLIGLFGPHKDAYRTSYYLSPEQSAHCHYRPAWHDHDAGITFIPCAVVVNAFSPAQIQQILQERSACPQAGEIIELLIHEQYFRKELDLYQPDIMDKVRAALDWVTAGEYEPVFWSDGFLGGL